jgi:ABC-type sugar transport system ATPase subunit
MDLQEKREQDPSRPLLEIRNLQKSFSGVTVLEDISFDLKSGEVHTLIGENGAGKAP